MFVSQFVGGGVWHIFSSPVHIVFLPRRALILWALCLFSNIYALFLKLKSLSQRFQLEKCGVHLSAYTLIVESDLLSVVKGIAGSVTRVNWPSFSFSQQQCTDKKNLLLWAANRSQVYILMFFFWLTESPPKNPSVFFTTCIQNIIFIIADHSPKHTTVLEIVYQLRLHYHKCTCHFCRKHPISHFYFSQNHCLSEALFKIVPYSQLQSNNSLHLLIMSIHGTLFYIKKCHVFNISVFQFMSC